MDFLTPPTDNLYKFLAVAGVAIALAAGFFESKQLTLINDSVFQTAGESETHRLIHQSDDAVSQRLMKTQDTRNKVVDQRIEELDKERAQLDILHDKAIADKANDTDKADYEQQSVAYKAKVQRLRADFDKANSPQALDEQMQDLVKTTRAEATKEAEILGRNVVNKAMLSQYEQDRKFYTWAILFGFGVSTTGFILWYFKVQRFQDQVLVAEAAEKAKQAGGTQLPAVEVPAPLLPTQKAESD